MQLQKMTLLVAALGLSLAACGVEGRASLACDADATCETGEICHPQAKVCVKTCADGAATSCPDSAKKCEKLSTTDTRNICKCTSDQLCQGDTTVTDASALKCDKTYSVCTSGTTTATCAKDADCAAGQVCDTTTKQCKATTTGATCTGTSQSTCSYGQYCGTSSTCAAAPEAPATCENFSKNRPTWSAGSSSGPVIYSVSRADYQVKSSYCQSDAPDAFIVRLRAYRTDASWPDTRSGLSGFFYVNTGATATDVVNAGLLVPGTGYNRTASNPKDAEFNVYLCRPSNSQTIQVGFYFTGGNPVCENINR